MLRIQAFAMIALPLICGCASGLARPVTSVEAVPDPDGVQRVSVSMHSFYFNACFIDCVNFHVNMNFKAFHFITDCNILHWKWMAIRNYIACFFDCQ